jgi:hypothetical protein
MNAELPVATPGMVREPPKKYPAEAPVANVAVGLIGAKLPAVAPAHSCAIKPVPAAKAPLASRIGEFTPAAPFEKLTVPCASAPKLTNNTATAVSIFFISGLVRFSVF